MTPDGAYLVLGEELGWRGYLLPQPRRAGRNRALVSVGLVHAIWHMPLILLTPIYHADGNMSLVLPLFTAIVIAASFVFGYLRLGTGRVLPAVLAHAVHNAAWTLLGAFMITPHPVIVEENLVGDNDLLILVTTALAAWWVRHRLVSREGLAGVAGPRPCRRRGGLRAEVVPGLVPHGGTPVILRMPYPVLLPMVDDDQIHHRQQE